MDNMTGSLKEFAKSGKKILGAALNYHYKMGQDEKMQGCHYKEIGATSSKSFKVKPISRALKAAKAPIPTKPVMFMKPSTSYITEGVKIRTPPNSEILEEVELGVIIGKECKDIEECDAMKYIGGYCLALDLTLTDLGDYRKKGFPWCMSKTFDTSCPVSRFVDLEELKDPHNIEVSCSINGKLQQKDNTCDLVFNIPQLISYCSQYMTLEPGDLILTGTGPNCGVLKPGDNICCNLGEIVCMQFDVE